MTNDPCDEEYQRLKSALFDHDGEPTLVVLECDAWNYLRGTTVGTAFTKDYRPGPAIGPQNRKARRKAAAEERRAR